MAQPHGPGKCSEIVWQVWFCKQVERCSTKRGRTLCIAMQFGQALAWTGLPIFMMRCVWIIRAEVHMLQRSGDCDFFKNTGWIPASYV